MRFLILSLAVLFLFSASAQADNRVPNVQFTCASPGYFDETPAYPRVYISLTQIGSQFIGGASLQEDAGDMTQMIELGPLRQNFMGDIYIIRDPQGFQLEVETDGESTTHCGTMVEAAGCPARAQFALPDGFSPIYAMDCAVPR